MGSEAAFNAGAIAGSMTLNISDYTRGMMQATSTAQIFPQVVTAFMANPLLGVASIAKSVAHLVVEALKAVVGAVTETAEHYDRLGKAAQKSGVSMKLIGEVVASAKLAEMGLDDVAQTFMFLNRSIAEGMDGDKTKIEAFAALGVAFVDSAGKARNAGDVFYDVADGMTRVESQSQKTKLAMDIMGRSGVQNLLMFEHGSAGIKSWAAKMGELSTGLDAGQMDKWANSLEKIGLGWDLLWANIKASVAAPIMEAISNNFDSIWSGMVQAGKEAYPIFQQVGREITAMLPMLMDSLPGILKGVASLAEILAGIIIPALHAVSSIIETIGASPVAIALLAGLGGIAGFMVGGPVGAAVGAGLGAAAGISGAVMSGSQTNNIYVDRPVIRDERDIQRLTDSFVNAQKQQIKEGL